MSVTCPSCGSGMSKVMQTEHMSLAIKRRRKCLRCSTLQNTLEIPYTALPDVSALDKFLVRDEPK